MTKADSTDPERELWDADTTPASTGSDSESDSSLGMDGDDDPDAELVMGSFVGRYQIVQRLGAGGMGVVYRAHDPQLDREVALKLLRAGRMGEQVAVLRMLREAKSAAKIRHPNVVTVYDAGQVDGRVFIAMELMRGTDLSKWFSRRPAWQAVVRVMLQAAQGLRAAHEAGLIHRDFKPDNVVLEHDGNVKVLDFGLARSTYDADAYSLITRDFANLVSNASTKTHVKLTRTGALMGTLAYMAPEQYAQQTLDARTDQFSFCVTLFMGVYGYRPFPGNTPAALTTNVLNGNLELPEDPTVAPTRLLDVLRKGLATNPDARFASMDELIDELQTILERDAGRGFGARVPRWTIAAGLLLLVGATAAGVAASELWPDDDAAEAADSGGEETGEPAIVDAEDELALELAAARGRDKPVDGPQIWMTADTLRVSAKVGGPHQDIALQAGPIERALIEALAPAAVSDAVTLHVDRRVAFSTVVSTIDSIERAGFLRYDFAVRSDDETRVLGIEPRVDGLGDGQLRDVVVELGIEQDRIRVGARAWADELELEPMRWPLDAGAGSCELSFATTGLESLGAIGTQLCQLEELRVSVLVSAEADVTWEQVVNVLGAVLPSTTCSRGVAFEAGLEAGMEPLPDCATPIAVAELGAKLQSGGAEQEFSKWCFINSRLRSKKECRPTQAACIAEAQHWVANPRRSCKGEP